MREDRLISLMIRHLAGELSFEEERELIDWALVSLENQRFLDIVLSEEELERELKKWKRIDPASAYAKWRASLRVQQRFRITRIAGWAAAACLLAALLVNGLVRKGRFSTQEGGATAKVSRPVLPGRYTATLTLANGHQLLLDSMRAGELAMQGSSRLVKLDNGSITYVQGEDKAKAVGYNVLTTPRSGEYKLVLPDGTRVWLNNVSSLRYPTSFESNHRTVELLSGEAYFEVAQDAGKPFSVKVRDETVEVLGTQFNIMAYPEEGGTQTTLLTGEVQVKTAQSLVKLKPDEQVQVLGGKLKLVKDVPSGDIVSWKDGFFYFDGASLESVMQQLARWYNVDVVYEGRVPNAEFGGKVDRSLPLDDLLKFLGKNLIHFRLEGRKLIVLPN